MIRYKAGGGSSSNAFPPHQKQAARVKLQPRKYRLPQRGIGLFFPAIYFHVLTAATPIILQLQYKSGQLTHSTAAAGKEFGLNR